MRPIFEMNTVQIELTSACVLKCSNCTRFCGTHQVPFFIETDQFHAAIDSLVGFAEGTRGIVGFMGGEPLLHPQFAEFCEYALARIPRHKLGLWTTFPKGAKFLAYRELIVKTLHKTDGNRTAAARLLGLDVKYLIRLMKALQIR